MFLLFVCLAINMRTLFIFETTAIIYQSTSSNVQERWSLHLISWPYWNVRLNQKFWHMKYMRIITGYIWTDYKTNAQIAKELKIIPILDKLLECKRSWIQHVNRLPRVMKHYSPTGSRNHGRPLERLLDTWDRNGSTNGPTPWKIYDDDYYYCGLTFLSHPVILRVSLC